jgi:hypothetical protein
MAMMNMNEADLTRVQGLEPSDHIPIGLKEPTGSWMSLRKATAKRMAQTCMRPIAARAWSRAPLNALYLHLGWYAKSIFFAAFRRAFQRGRDFRIDPGWWNIEFVGKTLKLPLVPERMWLDWFVALATLGDDVTVKKTYAAIVSSWKPDLFLDVGANYGTHSLLFLAHGISTWSLSRMLAATLISSRVAD